jgi:hypothetical protein
VDELRRRGVRLEVIFENSGPDLILAEENDAVAFRRDGGLVALGGFSGRAAGQGRDPDALVHSLGKAGGIRVVAMHFEIAAADVEERTAVRRPGKLGDLLAVVGCVVSELATLVGGRFGNPDVARAVLIEHPGDRSTSRGGGEAGREGSAHHLLERKARRRDGDRQGRRKKKDE